MQSTVENLTIQLATIGSLETMLASENHHAVDQFQVYTLAQINEAFGSFNFPESDQTSHALVVSLIELIKGNFERKTKEAQKKLDNLSNPQNPTRVADMFSYIKAVKIHSLTNDKPNQATPSILGLASHLVSAQKAVVQAALNKAMEEDAATFEKAKRAAMAAEALNLKAERAAQINSNAKAFGKKALIASLYTVGAGATVASALLQFKPGFAVLVGVHMSAAALATVAVAGVVMLAVAAYLTYRAYHPATPAAPLAETTTENLASIAPVVEAPAASRFAKFMNPALLVTGLNMMISSAALQFGPQVALLAALQSNPAALVAIAAVGTLLVSIALYRLCKTYLQHRAEAAAPSTTHNAENTAPAPASCYQRIMSHVPHCCFNLFKRAEQRKSADVTPDHSASARV